MPISPLLAQCSPSDGVIHKYLHWVCETTHAPALFHLGAIIPAVCYEATRRGLMVGETDFFHLLCCLVAGPGSAKSTAKNRAKTFIEEWYALTTASGHPPKPYMSLKGSLPGVLDKLTNMQTMTGPAAGTTPVIFDLDEVSLALGEKQVEDIVSQLYDGTDYSRQLVRLQQSGLNDTIKKPRIQAVFCGTQSSLEATVTANQVGGGLFSRILFIRQSVREEDLSFEERTWPDGRRWALDCWATWKHHLDVLFDTQLASRQIKMSDAANAFLKRTLWETAKRNIVEETKHAASSARLHHHARVIAACYALSETFLNSQTIRVGHTGTPFVIVLEEHMERAVALVEMASGTGSTEDFVGTLGVDPIQRLVAKIEGALRQTNGSGIVRSDLYRRIGKPNKALMDQALLTLTDVGLVTTYQETTAGRPRSLYVLTEQVNSKNDPIH